MKTFHPLFFLNDPYDASVDRVAQLINTFNFKLKNVGSHRTQVEYENIVIEFWSTNKYYAYFSQGNIYKNNELVFKWKDSRPSRKTLRKLINKIDDINIEKINNLTN
jgi:hypothetical protein